MRAAFATALLLAAIPAAVVANPIDVYTPRWLLKGGGSMYYNAGNVERVLARGDASLSHHNEDWAFATTTSYTWGTYSGKQTENDWSNRNFLYAWPEARLYPFVMHWLETGLRRRINVRNQAGLGATWAIFSAPASVLKLSLMASGEATDYAETAYLPDDAPLTTERPLPRWTPRLYYRQRLGDLLSLTSELWYQQFFRAANDYRWHLESGLEYKLGKTLSLKTQAIWHYESAVPVAVKRYDVIWTVGVTAEWKVEKPAEGAGTPEEKQEKKL